MIPDMPPAVRKVVYQVYAWVQVALLCASAGYVAAKQDFPTALVVVNAIVPVFGAGVGFLANSNVTQVPVQSAQSDAADTVTED